LDQTLITVLGIGGMFVLIFLQVPIGAALALAGLGGTVAILGWGPALTQFSITPTSILTSSELATIPLFLIMGSFAAAAGLSSDLYKLAYAFVGHRRGGLAMATIGGCGGFGAVCGSSIATAGTFMKIALPEMLQRKYEPALASGCIAAGGTLGILIPPSIIMVLYGVLTEQFIIALFTAAVIPGLISIALYFITIMIYVRVKPNSGPPGDKMSWEERLQVVINSWGVISLAVVVSGGIYAGIFTVVEAAAVGATSAFLFTAFRGKLTKVVLWSVLSESAATTGLIYLILIGASIFSFFVTLTELPQFMVAEIQALGLSPLMTISILLVMYIILGSIFDTVAAMVITLPFVYPVIIGLGYDPIWWGVINVMVIEIGLTTPPIGIIVFVLHGMAPDIPLKTIFTGILPFFAADILRLGILVVFPAISLWLPTVLGMMTKY
jgi:C4-dicarboxylate transporter, DctM subunit